MKFVGGPLDGNEEHHFCNPEDMPEDIYVRHTGNGWARWAYVYLSDAGGGRKHEMIATEEPVDFKTQFHYHREGELYVLKGTL